MSFDSNGFDELPKEDQNRSGYPIWYSNTGYGGHQMLGFPPMNNLLTSSVSEPIASTSHVDSTTKATKRTKRIRTAFTAHQLQVLEDAFFKCHYVSRSDRVELAQNLGLKDKAIKVWFQNRRMRYKKEGHRVEFNIFNDVRNESSLNQVNSNDEFNNIESKTDDIMLNNSEYFPHNVMFTKTDESTYCGDMEASLASNSQDADLQGETLNKIGSLVAQCITNTEQYAGTSSDDVIPRADVMVLEDGNEAGQLNLAQGSMNAGSWKQVYHDQFKNYNIHYVN